jgi:ABC-type amino acid transport system permease subunit
MELAIERLVALCCLVIGISHIVQARAWAELFIHWREKGVVGVFYTALLHFCLGALIVAFHNLWRGIPLLVTLLGWAWTIKGLLYLTYPKHGLKMLNRVSLDRAWEFAVAGAVILIIAAVLIYSLAARGAL